MDPNTYLNEKTSKATNLETSKKVNKLLNNYSDLDLQIIDSYFHKESHLKAQAEAERMDFNVVSYGGCGTNYIRMQCAEKYRITHIWNRKLCHYLRPLPILTIKNCIYVYRHPLDAVISQWSRNLRDNFYKMRDEIFLHLPFSFENLFFLMYQQMKNFKETEMSYKKYMLKYETAHKYQDELGKMLDLTFEFKPRDKKELSLDIDLNGQYYLKALEMYNSLPEFSVSN